MLPLSDILSILGIVAGALVAGFILEKLLLPMFLRRTEKRNWRLWSLAIRSLRGVIVLWFVLAALKFIQPMIPLKTSWIEITNKVLAVFVIISITIMLGRIAVGLMRLSSRNASAAAMPTTTILVNITKIVISLLGLLAIFHSLGIPVTPMLTALGVGGLAVALALQDTLSNLFSGLQIIATKQVEIGDFIKLSTGEEGQIVDIAWRVTTMKTNVDNLIIIPNAKFSSTNLTNFSRPQKYSIVVIPIMIAHGTDLEAAEKVAIKSINDFVSAGSIPLVTKPDVAYSDVTEIGVRMNIYIEAKEYPDQRHLRHRLIKTLVTSFTENGIRLADKERGIGVIS